MEFALVLPVVLLLLLGVIDFGRAVSAYVSLAQSAREGARAGIYPTATDADIRSSVRTQSIALGVLPDDRISISPVYPRQSGDSLQVVVSYEFNAYTPLLSALWGGGVMRMAGSARMKVE
ncbi:MAG: pilus assembly protein [Chloroflexi bacterium]|nr:pilus assembly protein [Chloroflexota bacterium]